MVLRAGERELHSRGEEEGERAHGRWIHTPGAWLVCVWGDEMLTLSEVCGTLNAQLFCGRTVLLAALLVLMI